MSKAVVIRLSLLLFILMLILASVWLLLKNNIVYAGENIWTWAGIGGYVEQIITDPLNPGTVYARLGDGRIMKSTNEGDSWLNIADPSWTNAGHIALAFSAPNVLYSGTYLSTDGGTTWQLAYPPSHVTGVAISPADWREGYLADNPFYESSVISKTIDGGQTWTTLSMDLPPGLALQDDVGPAINIAPSAPHIMIAKPANTNAGASLYKSTDGGQTWSEIPGPYDNVNVVTFDPKNSNTIYLGTHFSPGGWKSTDGGTTWQPLANGLQQNGRGFVIDPDNTEVVHIANGDAGVLESLDGGASWTPINTGIQGLEVRCIAIASRNPLVIYAGLAGGGIWKMTRTTVQDYSITINEGALFTNQTAVTLTLTAPPGTTQMVVSNDGGFGGATWEPFANSKSWTITAYGSYVIPRTVYVKFMTNGPISGQYQDDIVLDLTPPTGTVEITSTNGSVILPFSLQLITGLGLTDTLTHTVYLPIVTRNPRPGFTQIGLILSATDDLSGVGEMLIGNDADFIDAQWEAYIERKNWWIPNSSTTMYVKFRDRAGNESDTYTATVTP